MQRSEETPRVKVSFSFSNIQQVHNRRQKSMTKKKPIPESFIHTLQRWAVLKPSRSYLLAIICTECSNLVLRILNIIIIMQIRSSVSDVAKREKDSLVLILSVKCGFIYVVNYNHLIPFSGVFPYLLCFIWLVMLYCVCGYQLICTNLTV